MIGRKSSEKKGGKSVFPTLSQGGKEKKKITWGVRNEKHPKKGGFGFGEGIEVILFSTVPK